jgi:hypothetical protein
LVFPLVTVVCFAAGLAASRRFPVAFALLTGGRTPGRAAAIAGGNRAGGNRAGGEDSLSEAVVR